MRVFWLAGLLSGLERKTGWSLAEHAGEAVPDRMQRLFTTATWDHDAVRDDVCGYVTVALGGASGARPWSASAGPTCTTAGASHKLIKHLLSLSSARRAVLFTCGWVITAADEDAIRLVPADAWQRGTGQDGEAEDDKNVAEITDLMSRSGNWPDGLRGSPSGTISNRTSRTLND